MKKKTGFWSNPWTIGIGSTVLAAILLRGIDKLFGTETLQFIFEIISTPFIWLYSLFTIKISTILFVHLLLFVAGILSTITFLNFALKSNSNQDTFVPAFLKYTEDRFKQLYYRWNWVKRYDGKYRVSNITSMCPDCKCNIVYDSCPNCNQNYYGRGLTEAEVEALIHYNLEKRNM
jgi:hypothetical protein